ncbi:MAG: hypothetical protein M5R36_25150 [Deltaproteobacteria bacterium]|nr:hypothetical protein [Deltaproteobacteria bacterium]
MKGMRFRHLLTLWIVVILILSPAACGCEDDDDDASGDDNAPDDDGDDDGDDDLDDDSADGDDDTSDDDTDLGEIRSFHMAAAPFRFEVTDSSVRSIFLTEGFDGMVDAISLHLDGFFGLPWDAFLDDEPLPPAWVAMMEEIRAMAADLDVPVYLSATPIGGRRTGLAAKAHDVGGELVVEQDWTVPCFSFTTAGGQAIGEAYKEINLWLADFFDPTWMTHGIEMDFYLKFCPDQFDGLVAVVNDTYDALKAAHPELPVFPTFGLGLLYGEDKECVYGSDECLIDALEERAAIERDRLGLSYYPMFDTYELGTLPPDWFSRVAGYSGERLAFGETGFSSAPVVIPETLNPDQCYQLFDFDDQNQIDYMNFVFEEFDRLDSDLVVWWSIRDYLPDFMLETCPCDAPDFWCVLYDAIEDTGLLPAWLAWGSMGVLNYDLTEKPGIDTWRAWLAKTPADR